MMLFVVIASALLLLLLLDADAAEGSSYESNPGSARPAHASTHVPQPSAQLRRSFAACSGPRCSTHPGHAHSRPHVQPEPARDVIVLIGGMTAKAGMWSEGEGRDSS